MLRCLRLIGILAATATTVAASAGMSAAQTTAKRFLGREEIRLYGIGLKVEPSHQTVPRDIATIVSTFLKAPTMPGGLPPFAPDAEVRATLRGPSLQSPRELVIRPNHAFDIPPLTVAGIHTLDNIRLVSGGEVLLRGTPENVTIEVIERLLITQVTARALSAAEIREKGIVFDKTNFQAYNFSAAFAIEDRKVQVEFPVLLPSLQGAVDIEVGRAEIPAINQPSMPMLQTIIPDTLKLQTQIPNLSVVGFTLKVPELKGQNFLVPPIPGVIVIPGDIGFLNQFFSVMLMVGNVAPAGSNLVVDNLSAEIVLPPGYDQVAGSIDDPLAMARTAQGESQRIHALVQAGLDGTLGTPDDIVSIGPGESASAEYLVEGRREGSHIVAMEISATLHGLPVGPLQVSGRAAGTVLVRNPTFTLTFTHPEAVSAGEPYTLDVTVTNTSESPANLVNVSLYPRNVSGATIVGEPTRAVESIPAGDSATVTFDLVSRITGKVSAATLDSNENVSGRFGLKTAVGELGIPVSPDSLVLPKEARPLPEGVKQAAIGLLGKAWAVATAPAAALPRDVQRFSKKIVLDRAVELAEAGFRISLREPAPDSASQLLMDFAGSQFSRLQEFTPPGDLEFARANFNGFDALRRTSVRGEVFATAVGEMLSPSLTAAGPQAFHFDLAQKWSYRAPHLSIFLSGPGGPLPYSISVVDGEGRRVGGTRPDGRIFKDIPYSDVVPLGTAGAAASAELLLVASPLAGEYRIRIQRRAGVPSGPVTMSLVLPDAAGNLRQAVFILNDGQVPSFTQPADDPFRFSFAVVEEPGALPVAAVSTSPVPDPPPTVLGVVQQAQADLLRCDPTDGGIALGRVIAVLFSEEVTAQSVQDKLGADLITNAAVDNNKVVGVALQPGRRIAFVALRDPFGPHVPRQITFSNIVDRRGQITAASAAAIEATIDQGGIVSGQILQADGTPVPFADVRLFYRPRCISEEPPPWVGITAKTADANGRYSFDFVTRELGVRIVAISPEAANDFRSVPFTIARNGQRLNVDIVFLGRGTFAGRTLNEQGAALAHTDLRITSLTDQSPYGARSDALGRFTVSGIPVGNVFVEAVNTAVKAEVKLSDYIPFAGATVTRDLLLLDVAQQEIIIKRGALSGHVLRSDGFTPAAGVPVVVWYGHNSQPGVRCLGAPDECAIAMVLTGVDGSFAFPEITAGKLRVHSFDQGELSEGAVRFALAENQAHELNVLLSGGLGTVRGVVLDAAGHPVPNARVGGGLSLSTTNPQGEFTLTDVPTGHRIIVAVSDAIGSRGSADIDILRAGETVNATIVLDAIGAVAGVVRLADGVTPVARGAVYLFKKAGDEGIQVVGSATTDAQGGFRIEKVPAGDYLLSSFNDSFTDGNVIPVKLRLRDQVFKADIRYRGGNGTVQGTVFDVDDKTPLRAKVAISGDRLVVAAGKVGVEFQHVQYFTVVDTNLTTGVFSISGVWVGNFTLSAAGQFSPDPIAFEGNVPEAGTTVQVRLRLQATSEIAGVVYQPDGLTPVGAGTIVRYKSNAFKVVCTTGQSTGEESCVSIPQGIQNETVITGDDGRFWLPVVNAGEFTLTVEETDGAGVPTGRGAEARGAVRAGERAEMSVRLLQRADLTVSVFASNGTTSIAGARVEAEQIGHPRKKMTFFADTTGIVSFAGGDAFSEGDVIVTATHPNNGFTGRASARLRVDGLAVALKVFLFDATGSVQGTLRRSDGATPVANAEIVIANSGGPLALTLTDANGRYEAVQIPLGDFTVDAFEAATARRAAGAGRIDLANQQVAVNPTQLAIGMVKGTVLLGGSLSPLKAWTVQLGQPSVSGVQRPHLQTTTGLDGTFSFPGAAQGPFSLIATRSSVNGSAQASGALVREGQIVDVPMVATVIRQLYGRVQGTIFTPTGQPAANSIVEYLWCFDEPCAQTTAGADGTFAFAQVPLGRWIVNAKSQVSADSGSTVAELLVDGDVADVRIVMVGLSEITGYVEFANGGARASNVQLKLEGYPSAGCAPACVRFADANGMFTFPNVAAERFTVTAVDPISRLQGSVGGSINPGEQKVVRIVLEPTGRVDGRVLSANGNPAAGIVAELSWNADGLRSLFAISRADGTFTLPAVPMVAYTLTLQDPIGSGTARRTGQLSGNLTLGDLVLDEAPPLVVSLDPSPSATAVPLSRTVHITFSEPILPGTITPASVVLEGPNGPLTTILDVSDNDRVVTVKPLASLKDDSQYTLRVRQVSDRLGKVMPADYVASFRTVDIKAPTWLDVSPAANTGGVTIYTPIRVKFSEPIDPQAFEPPLELRNLAGVLVAGRLDVILGNTVLVYTPNVPFAEDAVYRVRLGAATDLHGNSQPLGLDFTFSTTDRTPPQIAALTASNNGVVIENAVARVTADVGASHDVGVVDFYINGVLTFADSTPPFELAFQATAQSDVPGPQIAVSAIATDSSGNRGSPAATGITVIADQPPAVAITSPAPSAAFANGARVTVTVRATDDLGVTRLAYRALTGRPQDAVSRVIAPASLDRVESFAFNVPVDLAPGAPIEIQASAIDTKGQTVAAAPIRISVIDSIAPTITITGATTGVKVNPGQSTTAVVTAQDPGGVASIAFTAAGAASFTQTRQVDPGQTSVVTSFTFSVPANAQPGQTVTLDAVAIDRAGNQGQAARVVLPVADRNRPTVRLRLAQVGSAAVPGRGVDVIAEVEDEIGVTHVELTGQGAFSYSDARQVTPPSGSAALTFTVPVPTDAAPGSLLTLQARAFDLSGNASLTASLALTITQLVNVTLPPSVLIVAGETTAVDIEIPGGAPAPGLQVDLQTANATVATVDPFVRFAAGETTHSVAVKGVAGGTTSIVALVQGVERATMTATVRGGIVGGTVFDSLLNPIAGVDLTITGEDFAQTATTGPDGKYAVEGIRGPSIEVRALDPVSRLRGFANGTMSPANGAIELNVVLVPAGRVVGSVYLQDRRTLAGEHVRVDIYDVADRSTPLTTTFTGADGAFEFPLVAVGSYVVSASDDGGNRGDATVTITATGEDRQAAIVYLGRGTVVVAVRDGSGNPVPNARIRFSTQSIIGWQEPVEVSADSDGTYTFESVFVGNFSVVARDLITNRAGTMNGNIAQHAQIVNAWVTLASFGSVHGTVYRAGGTTIVAGARVIVNPSYTTFADDQGRYDFPVLPLGTVAVTATDDATNGVGTATGTIGLNGATITIDVVFVPQGTVVATVIDAGGAKVADVPVIARSGPEQAYRYSHARTDADGIAILPHVQAGSVTVSATAGNRAGYAAATVGPNQTIAVTVQLAPTASIAGSVYEPDGVTPVSGGHVVLRETVETTAIAPDGKYRFDGLLLTGSYTVEAYDPANVKRASTQKLVLATHGQVRQADLVFVGLGTVAGQVLGPDSQPAGNLLVQVRGHHPQFGGFRNAMTDANGNWVVRNVAVGIISVWMGDANRGLLGEGTGVLGAHGDEVRIDVILQANAITLPKDRYDGNNFLFDVQTDGSIERGRASAYVGSTGSNAAGGAALLDLVNGATATPFEGGAIGTIEDGGREIATRQTALGGVNVTRKIFVPRDGYFARYLETIANPTEAPVTVDVRLRSRIRGSSTHVCDPSGCRNILGPHVIATSSGDSVLDVADSSNRDRWAVFDSDTEDADPFLTQSVPSLAFVFEGIAPSQPAGTVTLTSNADPGELAYEWHAVTIQPGESVSFMHFLVQQISRAAAIASAERLVQLPPETLAGLSSEEISRIRNFIVAPDGTSTLEPLASRAATITGRMLEGDGVTPVPFARLTFRSDHPLFGATHSVVAEGDGQFTVASTFNDTGSSRVVPAVPFTLASRHPRTDVAASPASGTFPAGVLNAQRDVIYPTGAISGLVRRHSGQVVSGGFVTLTGPVGASTPIGDDGRFFATGLAGGNYAITATVPNVQGGTGIRGVGAGTVAVGGTTDVPILLEPTGSMRIAVRRGSLQPAAEVQVLLTRASFGRAGTTDSAGSFTFADVPVGGYVAQARDPATQIASQINVAVTQDTQAESTITLIRLAPVRVQVTTGGAGRDGAAVRMTYTRGSVFKSFDATTTGDGWAEFLNIPEGPFTVTATHPVQNLVKVTVNGSVAEDGLRVDVVIPLSAVGSVTGIVSMPAPDGAVAPGLVVSLLSANPAIPVLTATTDAQGRFRFDSVPGAFNLFTQDATRGLLGTASGHILVEGSTVTVDILLQSNFKNLPTTLFDANGFLYDVDRFGGLNDGTRDAYDSGLWLQLRRNARTENFPSTNSAATEEGGRELLIRQDFLDLQVTRKIFVPTDGYAARYLEILHNPGVVPATLELVEVRSNLGSDSSTRVVGTSSGDAAFEIDDLWLVTDDDAGNTPYPASDPTLAHVFGGPAASQPVSAVVRVADDLRYQWKNVTIPPGGTIIFMHFAVQHATQPQARAAAERLVQLPPEALDGLSAEEIAAIVNFAVPADGSSSLPRLVAPPLGTITGRVLAHDGVTVLVPSTVTVANTEPIFRRLATASAVSDGSFIASIRASEFTVRARLSTGIDSPVVTRTFDAAGTTAQADVVFSNTGGIAGAVRLHAGAPVSGGTVTVGVVTVPIAPNGRYFVAGLLPGEYAVTARPAHLQGDALAGVSSASVQAGVTTPLDVVIEATGRVTGIVRRPHGVAAPGVAVHLNALAGGWHRAAIADANGRFQFDDVRLGAMTVVAVAVSGVEASPVLVTVTQDAVEAIELVLGPSGTIIGLVTNPDGSAVGDAIVRTFAGEYDWSVRTDGNGRYTLEYVPASEGLVFTVQASAPPFVDGPRYRLNWATVANDGETIELNFTMPARARVRVLVKTATGDPYPNVVAIHLNGVLVGGTNSSGVLEIAPVAEGTVTIKAYDQAGFGPLFGASVGEVTAADHGGVVEITVRRQLRGRVRGTIVAADNVTPVRAWIDVCDSITSQSRCMGSMQQSLWSGWTDSQGGYESAAFDAHGGGFDVFVRRNPYNMSYSASAHGAFARDDETVTLNFTLPLSVLKGRVMYLTGEPVSFPGVFAMVRIGNSVDTYYASTDEAGNYLILDVPVVTPFVLKARDAWGLGTSVQGEIVDPATALTLDVQLPAFGRIEGTVIDPAGAPVPSSWVELSMPGDFRTGTSTDESGQFAFDRVATGLSELVACDTVSYTLCGTAIVELTAQDQVATPTIRIPRPAILVATVYQADGITPMVSGMVWAQSEGPRTFNSTLEGTLEAPGRFRFDRMPSGNFTVFARDFDSSALGASRVTLVAGRTAEATVTLGTAAEWGIVFWGSDGFRYDINCEGRIESGGLLDAAGNAYSYALGLEVDGYSAPCLQTMALEQNGREVILGPGAPSLGDGSADEIAITRKVYVPPAGGFARYLDVVHNRTNLPKTMAVRVFGALGSSSSTQVIAASEATGQTYAVTRSASDSEPSVGHVFAGLGALVPAVATFAAGQDYYDYTWEVTLLPNQVIGLLHFAVQRRGIDVAAAEAQSLALSMLADPDALTGLSPEERGLIVNFVVPGAVAPVSGGLEGVVVDAAGAPLATTVYAFEEVSGRLIGEVATNVSGHYVFPLLRAPGGEVRLLAMAPSDPTISAVRVVTFTTGQTLTAITLTVPIGGVADDNQNELIPMNAIAERHGSRDSHSFAGDRQ